MIITYYCRRLISEWGYSSVVEHLTADQEVSFSNLGPPNGLVLLDSVELVLPNNYTINYSECLMCGLYFSSLDTFIVMKSV